MTSFYEWMMVKADWRVSSGAMKGKRFTFDAFPCQRDIVKDEAKAISIMKSAQMAVSEQFSVARPFYYMDIHKINWGILFPDQGAMQNFFRTRLKPAAEINKYIKRVIDAQNQSNINAFDRTLFLRYTTTEGAVATFDASGVTVDEMDIHDSNMLYGAQTSRTQGSMDEPWWHEVSTPTYPMVGINKSFLDGDQRVWLVRCGACGEDNDLSVKIGPFENHDIEKFFREYLSDDRFKRWEDYFFPCSNCGSKLDAVTPIDNAKKSLGGGRWVSRYPNRDRHAYHLQIWQRNYRHGSPEVLYRVRNSLLKAETPEAIGRWWNSTCGMVHQPKEGKLTDADLANASTDEYSEAWTRDMLYPTVMHIHGETWDWMGTDIRDEQYHFIALKRISDTKTLVCAVGWVESRYQVRELWERYGEPFHVPDSLPDINATRDMAKSMGRRCARGSLGKNINTTFTPANEDGLILISRPKVMEAVKASVESMAWVFPRAAWSVGAGIFQQRDEKRKEERLSDHFKAPTMVKKTDEYTGNVVYDFPHEAMGGIDPHYFMAACFAYVASKVARAPAHAVTIPR